MTQESRREPARRPPPRPPRLRRRQLEHEERAALGARRHHLLAHLSEERRDGERAPRDDRDVLLAVDGIRHRRRADAGAGPELPQRLSGLGVERLEPAVDVAVEEEPAGRRRDAADVPQGVLVAPDLLLLARVPGDHFPEVAAPPPPAELEIYARVKRAAPVPHRRGV